MVTVQNMLLTLFQQKEVSEGLGNFTAIRGLHRLGGPLAGHRETFQSHTLGSHCNYNGRQFSKVLCLNYSSFLLQWSQFIDNLCFLFVFVYCFSFKLSLDKTLTFSWVIFWPESGNNIRNVDLLLNASGNTVSEVKRTSISQLKNNHLRKLKIKMSDLKTA